MSGTHVSLPKTHDWAWSSDKQAACQVLEVTENWGQRAYRVWFPDKNTVIRIPAGRLRTLGEAGVFSGDAIAYRAAASRVADALTQDTLLAPIEVSVIPLPHQIQALSRATADDRVRYLLCDEVGLGKTIEAGLIMRELKLRGLVSRTLVVAPKGLVTQWVAEMKLHFNEDFKLLIPSDLAAYRRITQDDNIWQSFPQVICPMDSVKPLDGRRGWTREQTADYNRERFEDLVSAGWDLVVVDEAHRLGGSTEQVARYKLGRGLSDAAPYVLLLSATPHQGKTDAFHRLVSLLDSDDFPDVESVTKERVQPYVIRTEKRRAINADGKPLFKPRRTQLIPVSWGDSHREQHVLYEAVTEYVRNGYNRAIQEKRNYIGFLMILMQRLVTSSTRAIRTTLERRLEALDAPPEQLTLFPISSEEEWEDLDGQEQMETLLKSRLDGLRDEREEVKLLLAAARRCEEACPDVKAEALLSWIYRLQQEERDPDLKILIFAEFVPTQSMLAKFLSDRGFSVVCLNGSMDMEERRRVQNRFAADARIMISTDAGGEGLNLQFCHVVINFDIPWNPMRLEQRIGRVDRIGQNHVVRALNFVFEDTVEHRVREVLEEKLTVICEEFGIDKTGDVLDSAQAGEIFDELYLDAILHPESVEEGVEKAVRQIRDEANASREAGSVLGDAGALDPGEAQRLISHPLPHWVERMTVSYLGAHGGKAEKHGRLWDLVWPDGTNTPSAVFNAQDAERHPAAEHLTLEDNRIRILATRLPRFVIGQPIPVVSLPGLTGDIKGMWSVWRISVHAENWERHRILPLFVHDDGRCLVPTARRIWDQLMTVEPEITGTVRQHEAEEAFRRLFELAESHGRPVYNELVQMHRKGLTRERGKGEYAFAARRRTIERIGLPEVRNHRRTLLAEEEEKWRDNLTRKGNVSPELLPLLLLRVSGGRA